MGARRRLARHVPLVGEVDGRLYQGVRGDQPLPPALVRPERAPGLAQGLAPLRRGLGVDEVGEALDTGQIELAVLEGAAGELAGLRQPAALSRRAPRARPHDGPAAVHLQLRHVLAGLALGAREPKYRP